MSIEYLLVLIKSLILVTITYTDNIHTTLYSGKNNPKQTKIEVKSYNKTCLDTPTIKFCIHSF